MCAEVAVPFLFSNNWLNGASDLLTTHLSKADIIDEVLMEGLGVDLGVENTAGKYSSDMVILFVNSMTRHRVVSNVFSISRLNN